MKSSRREEQLVGQRVSDRTIGVELEYLLVDAAGAGAPDGPELANGHNGDDSGELQSELIRCQAGNDNGGVRGRAGPHHQLTELRDRAVQAAGNRGLRLVGSGTPVLSKPDLPRLTSGSRYDEIADWFGAVAHTANTCGCHVHVAIPDRTTGVEVSNQIRPWLPVLLALSANSPFNEGIDTSYESWRYIRGPAGRLQVHRRCSSRSTTTRAASPRC